MVDFTRRKRIDLITRRLVKAFEAMGFDAGEDNGFGADAKLEIEAGHIEKSYTLKADLSELAADILDDLEKS